MDCCTNSGGRVALTIDGRAYSARASVTIRPLTFSREAGANQDGSLYVTTKPKPATAEITLSDRCGLNISDLLHKCKVDATIDIVDMNKTWLFSQASVVGDPEYDTESGEIKGITIASAVVKMIEN